MKINPRAEIYIPRRMDADKALARTTHLAIGAHQDDLEMMAVDGILKCYQQTDKWFTGVVMTNGSGSPRSGIYADYTDEEMMAVRDEEQKRTAHIGDYSAQVFFRYTSAEVKDRQNSAPKEEIKTLVAAASPEIIYTHNLADKHPTHIAVAVNVVKALRELPDEQKPQKLYGCEVWRDLGWMMDSDKVVFDCTERQNLQQSLLGVFDSQISGGKRYDLAAMGRRVANATFMASHDTDSSQGLSFGMDLTPLIKDPHLDIRQYVQMFINRFAEDVHTLLGDE